MTKIVKKTVKNKVYQTLLQSLKGDAPHEKAFLDLFKKYAPYQISDAIRVFLESVPHHENDCIQTTLSIYQTLGPIQNRLLEVHAICEGWNIGDVKDIQSIIDELGEEINGLGVCRVIDELKARLYTDNRVQHYPEHTLPFIELRRTYFILYAQLNRWDISRYLAAA